MRPRYVGGERSTRELAGWCTPPPRSMGCLMSDTDTRTGDTPQDSPRTRHTVVVPNSINMVQLLGPRDEHLALLERAFDADLHVRGNQVTLTGDPGDVALA